MSDDNPLIHLSSIAVHEPIYGPDGEEMSINDPRCEDGIFRCGGSKSRQKSGRAPSTKFKPCGKLKLRSCFRVRSPSQQGRREVSAYCYPCEVDYKRELRKQDPEKARRQDREKYEKYGHKARAQRKQDYEANPDKYWAKRLWSLYRMIPDDYYALLDAQGGVCPICGRPPEDGKRLVIDHAHGCCPGRKSCGNCWRGLVHDSCNQAIGLLHDDPAECRAAADYLERSSAVRAC